MARKGAFPAGTIGPHVHPFRRVLWEVHGPDVYRELPMAWSKSRGHVEGPYATFPDFGFGAVRGMTCRAYLALIVWVAPCVVPGFLLLLHVYSVQHYSFTLWLHPFALLQLRGHAPCSTSAGQNQRLPILIMHCCPLAWCTEKFRFSWYGTGDARPRLRRGPNAADALDVTLWSMADGTMAGPVSSGP